MSAPPDRISELLHSIQSCLSDAIAWATANMLKLNDSKKELMLVTSKRTFFFFFFFFSFRLIPKKLMSSYTGMEECQKTNTNTKRKM